MKPEAKAKYEKTTCFLWVVDVEHVSMVLDAHVHTILPVINQSHFAIWRHWTLMIRWFHELFSKSKQYKLSKPKKSYEVKKVNTSVDIGWPQLIFEGPRCLFKPWEGTRYFVQMFIFIPITSCGGRYFGMEGHHNFGALQGEAPLYFQTMRPFIFRYIRLT